MMTYLKPQFCALLFFSSLWILSACDSIFFGQHETEQGTKYYVSLQGDDANPGSKSKPWKTIAKVNETDFQPGDQILFEGGSTFEGIIELDQNDTATAKFNIHISSFGEGRATIDAGNTGALIANNCDHLNIHNLIFMGSGRLSGNTSDGVLMNECDSITLSELEVYGFQHSGIHVHKSVRARILEVYAHDNGFAGIHVTGSTMNDPEHYDNSDLYIGNCIAENNPGDPTVLAGHSGNGILASSVDGGIIEYCEAFNNGWDMPWDGNGPVGIWIWDANDFIIQHCIAHHNKTAKGAHDGGGFDFDGGVSNSILQYNLSFENEGPGIGLFEFGAAKPWKNNIVRYNLSVDDGLTTDGGLRIWKAEGKGEMYGCDIYNNTIINSNSGNYAIGILTNVPGIRFINNIFLYDKEFIWLDHGFGDEEFNGNIYWNMNQAEEFMNFPSFESWAESTKHEMNEGSIVGSFADPMIYNVNAPLPTKPTHINKAHLFAFYPSASSPAIDKGLLVREITNQDPGENDLMGNQIPSGVGYDIGALEYQER
jgi:hypothetical protein